MKLTHRSVYHVFPLVFAMFCGQVAAPMPGHAAREVAEQAAELLRQQIVAWEMPSPESASAPTSEPSDLKTDAANISQAAPSTTLTKAQPEKLARSPRPKLMVGNETLRTATLLARFYEARVYRLAWSTDSGPLPRAIALLDGIQINAEREGLPAENYRLGKIRTLLQELKGQEPDQLDPQALADLDLLLTNAFFLYGVHVAIGTPRFDALDAQWFEDHQKIDFVPALQQALETNQIANMLKNLPPQHPEYGKLRETLARYRELAARGEWLQFPVGFDLRPGDHDERIPKLRARLQVTGELTPPPPPKSTASGKQTRNKKEQHSISNERNIYDTTLVQAVKRFQKRHGLAVDGVIGSGTLAALNVSIETRIRQIIANMKRWRELPNDLGNRYIAVNIPNFTLDLIENEQLALHMKVVVGKMVEERNTPTFTANMTYLVLNPYWHVPKSIAEKELFPLSKKNPQYFAQNNFIVRRVAVEKQIPDPKATDGSMIAKTMYRYDLKQEPGPKNALGRVKFIFPNSYGVYLHDTPAKDFFNRSVRTYSHGCIRIEKPIDLAEYLLRGTEKWTRSAILDTIGRQKEKKVPLPEAIPVYIQYWTAWVDDKGIVQFRNDIYGYDNVPEARLPIPSSRNPRPQPEPAIQPVLQEAQTTQEQPRPEPQAESQSATQLEASPSPPTAPPTM
ncbi:MAG: L,D-transpeptidase family protein [Candidatus Binatia bacterium]